MTEKFFVQDNSDLHHEISCSNKRIVVAAVKTYDTTGTYITLRLFKKDFEELRFKQRITLSAAEFDLLGQKIKTIQDLSSRGTTKKSKRRQRSGCEVDLEERPQYEGRRAKESRQKITNKASESEKELNTKMVKAMVERTPEYFRQFAKQYRYFICQSEPIFDHTVTKNFAYCLHMNDNFL